MDIKKLTQEVLLKNMTPEQQLAVLDSVTASVKEAKAVQKQKIAENVDLVLQALKRIEADMLARVQNSAKTVEDRVKTIKDGKDGKNGLDGKAGKDGKDGKNGLDGRNGRDGLNGKAGERGQDGVGVQDAHIDFDGSLIISLTDGRVLNVGEVIPFDMAEKIRVIGNGGGTSQYVLDAIADLQTQINNFGGGLSYKGTWNASTNTPTLTSGSGTNGWYYVVNTAGSTNLNGITDWQVGDWAIFNGSTWQKIDQTNLVTSVAGRTGDVTLTSTDVGLANVENKSSATIRGELTSSNVTTALGYTPYNATNPAGYTNNTGTVTSVAVSGGTTGLTTSGGPVTTSGTITLAGTLAIANGGTGSTTASAALTALGAYPASNPNGYTSNTGTVTSVTGTSPVVSSGGTTPAISLAASYGDTQNPYASKTANYVLAAPNGSSGVPTFRAIVASDIPTLNQNTTGTASNVTGIVSEANGGTGTSAGNRMFKNRIINGAMMIDQRNSGTSQSIGLSVVYTIDRWYAQSIGVATTGQRVTGSNGFQYSYQLTGAALNTGTVFGQKIEAVNCYDLASSTVTLSAFIKSSTLTSVTWTAYYPTASDNYTSRTQISTGTFTINTTSSQYSVNISLPSNVANGLQIEFSTGAFTSGTITYTGVQLEKGSTATSFDYRPYGAELALCQRYYFKQVPLTAAAPYAMGHGINTTAFRVCWKLAQTMRAQPTFSYATPLQWSFGNAVSALAPAEYTADAISIDCTTTGTSTNGAFMLTAATNTNSYLAASAEL